MGADGSDPRLVTTLGIYDSTWSPDGKQIAFTGLDNEIHVVNLDGTGHRQLTTTGGSAGTPDWSPDGTRLVFRRGPELAIISVGGGEPSVLVSPRDTTRGSKSDQTDQTNALQVIDHMVLEF